MVEVCAKFRGQLERVHIEQNTPKSWLTRPFIPKLHVELVE